MRVPRTPCLALILLVLAANAGLSAQEQHSRTGPSLSQRPSGPAGKRKPQLTHDTRQVRDVRDWARVLGRGHRHMHPFAMLAPLAQGLESPLPVDLTAQVGAQQQQASLHKSSSSSSQHPKRGQQAPTGDSALSITRSKQQAARQEPRPHERALVSYPASNRLSSGTVNATFPAEGFQAWCNQDTNCAAETSVQYSLTVMANSSAYSMLNATSGYPNIAGDG